MSPGIKSSNSCSSAALLNGGCEKLIELGEWLDHSLVKTRLGAIKLPPSDNETTAAAPDISSFASGGLLMRTILHIKRKTWGVVKPLLMRA
jgi:hypothetical protein